MIGASLGNVTAVYVDFASKLNYLFETILGPDGKPYTHEDVSRGVEAAGRTTISKAYLSELRTGKKDNPTLKHMEALAEFFGVTLHYFSGDDEYTERVQAELNLLAKMRRAGVSNIALRASDLSDSSLSIVEAVLETVLKTQAPKE